MTLKEALDSGYCNLEDDIDFDDTPQGEKIACLKLEIERLENIIKEVREYIKSKKFEENFPYVSNECQVRSAILEILDKENKE